MKLIPIENQQTHFPSWIVRRVFGGFGATRKASADCFPLPDPVSERRVGERGSAPTQEKPTSPGRTIDRKAKDDSRRVVKSAQDLSDVSMDEVGIPLRVRILTEKAFLGLLLSQGQVYTPVCMRAPPMGFKGLVRRVLTIVHCLSPLRAAEPPRAVLQPPEPTLVLGSVCSSFSQRGATQPDEKDECEEKLGGTRAARFLCSRTSERLWA